MVLKCRRGIDTSRRFLQLLSLKTQFEEVAGAREYLKDEWSISEWLILRPPEVQRRNPCTCRSPRLRMLRPFKRYCVRSEVGKELMDFGCLEDCRHVHPL